MKKYADIIVNISHEAVDRAFQYSIPEELLNQVEIGSYVKIPFGSGNTVKEGYVLDISDIPKWDPEKTKSIISVQNDNSLVESRLIKVAYFLKKNYGSTMINALKTVLPIKKKIKAKEEKTIVLKLSKEEALEKLALYDKKSQKARYRLLSELINEEQLDYSLVVQKLNISLPTIKYMTEQGVIDVEARRIYRNSVNASIQSAKKTLNPSQQKIADKMISDYEKGIRDTYLLRGVTGSGKTEIYMEFIDRVIEKGQQVIVLIPEIALTYQTVLRFTKRYGDRVSTLHSKLSQGERYDQFARAKNGQIDVMIGPRSALFTPFSNIGLIVIDEEHENSYKSENMPKYHAREVAIELARLHNASVVLGSATPSIEAFYRAKKGEYTLFELDERANRGSLPKAQIVDLREELKSGNTSMFSRELKEKIEDRLLKHEQVMLFLNRRGYAGFVSCRACGHVFKCPHCDVSLSLHGKNKMLCHYCGFEVNKPALCPECGSYLIGTMKAGTEAVEESVKTLFPMARTLRMDADTTKQKDGYEAILSAFANEEADILVGTQMIVKGHDFPKVTLVGILAADISLHANDYRAAERTFQLITQAAGRAGRSNIPGEVVIQTYSPDSYAIINAAKQDYNSFYNEEIDYRELLSYPPAGHMMLVLMESGQESILERASTDLAMKLKNDIIKDMFMDKVRVVGPAEASISRINDIFRRVIYVKSNDYNLLTQIKDNVELIQYDRVRITFDFDPMMGY